MSVVKALDCAVTIRRGVRRSTGAEWPLSVRSDWPPASPSRTATTCSVSRSTLRSRVCDACEPGIIFVSSTVRDLAVGKRHEWDDVGEHSFKGFDEPVRVYRLRWWPERANPAGDCRREHDERLFGQSGRLTRTVLLRSLVFTAS